MNCPMKDKLKGFGSSLSSHLFNKMTHCHRPDRQKSISSRKLTQADSPIKSFIPYSLSYAATHMRLLCPVYENNLRYMGKQCRNHAELQMFLLCKISLKISRRKCTKCYCKLVQVQKFKKTLCHYFEIM